MRVAAEITLSKEEHRKLEKWASARSTSVRLRERARIVLMACDGMTNKAIAASLLLTVLVLAAEAVAGNLVEFSRPAENTVAVSPRVVIVPEGGASDYAVVLTSSPVNTVTVAVARSADGDDDLSVAPTSLIFTPLNWGTPQWVTVSAAEDDDVVAGTAAISHSAISSDSDYDGIEVAAVSATESDDDIVHDIHLFALASNKKSEGFVRIINHSDEAGEVRIEASDDHGARFGPVFLNMEAKEAKHLNSVDLAEGNSSKGLSRGLREDGVGNWRLRLFTELNIEPLAYIRSADSIFSATQEVPPSISDAATIEYDIPTFNPGTNTHQRSWLHLVNQTDDDVNVTVTGVDDWGKPPPEGAVTLMLPARDVRTISAQQLESGHDTFHGRFGDGAGKWRLSVSADGLIVVMNLLENATGHLSNLSTPGVRRVSGEVSGYSLPMFPAASNLFQQGFARIINHSHKSGIVAIHGIDDKGTSYGPIELSLPPSGVRHFNSKDLEKGNSSRGLVAGLGDGEGNWRLIMRTELDIESLVYTRSGNGFVSPMHELVRNSTIGYHVPIFNPGSNFHKRSLLRLVNTTTTAVDVTIAGLDDTGSPPPGGKIHLTLPSWAARVIDAQGLESGETGFRGHFGDGIGKWRLFVHAAAPISVMNLLQTSTGDLVNLSAVTPKEFRNATITSLGQTTDTYNFVIFNTSEYDEDDPTIIINESYAITTENIPSQAEVLEFLSEQVGISDRMRIRSSPPVLRFVRGVSPAERLPTHRAVDHINAWLPYQKHLTIGEDLDTAASEALKQGNTDLIPEGVIGVDTTGSYVDSIYPDYPGAVLGISGYKAIGLSRKAAESVAAHELLHSLDYSHRRGVTLHPRSTMDAYSGRDSWQTLHKVGLSAIDGEVLQAMYTRFHERSSITVDDLSMESKGSPWDHSVIRYQGMFNPELVAGRSFPLIWYFENGNLVSQGSTGFSDGHHIGVGFGVDWRNGLARPWTRGGITPYARFLEYIDNGHITEEGLVAIYFPISPLEDEDEVQAFYDRAFSENWRENGRSFPDTRNPFSLSGLTGVKTWRGELVGFTPRKEAVHADVTVLVDLEELTGTLRFDNFEVQERRSGGAGDTGNAPVWGDGNLEYRVAIHMDVFRGERGDDGYISGNFTGDNYKGVVGILEHSDLSAAFGATLE